MSEYLLTVLGSVLLCAFITTVLPEGKTSNTVKGVTKTVCLLVIITPVLTFLQKTGKETEKSNVIFQENVIPSNGEFIQYYSELRVRNAETLLQQELMERFNAKTNVSLTWKCNVDENGYNCVEITKITIRLFTEKTQKEIKNMSAYLTEHYCSEVLIE